MLLIVSFYPRAQCVFHKLACQLLALSADFRAGGIGEQFVRLGRGVLLHVADKLLGVVALHVGTGGVAT